MNGLVGMQNFEQRTEVLSPGVDVGTAVEYEKDQPQDDDFLVRVCKDDHALLDLLDSNAQLEYALPTVSSISFAV
jgi:hypothetical protein